MSVALRIELIGGECRGSLTLLFLDRHRRLRAPSPDGGAAGLSGGTAAAAAVDAAALGAAGLAEEGEAGDAEAVGLTGPRPSWLPPALAAG